MDAQNGRCYQIFIDLNNKDLKAVQKLQGMYKTDRLTNVVKHS